MTARREMATALGLCAAASSVALLAAGRVWGHAQVAGVERALHGNDGSKAVSALALVGLASVVAMLATRGLSRLAVAVTTVLVGAGIVAAVSLWTPADSLGEPAVQSSTTAWPIVAAVSGGLLALAGLLVVVRSRRWSSMSARYDAPTAPRERDLWTAMDAGDDPTA